MQRILVVVIAACSSSQQPVSSEHRGLGPNEIDPPTALAIGSCDDAPLLTLVDLAAGKGAGERIAIDVTPVAEIMCTLLACGDDDACCNQCGGGYGAKLEGDPDLELRLDGLAGCGGMDCNIHCEPFGRRPKTAYRFVGANTFRPAGQTSVYHQATLKVEKYCRR